MAELNWIPKEERLPTAQDANSDCVVYGLQDRVCKPFHINNVAIAAYRVTHWLPFREMPVPERWRVPTIHDLAKAGKEIPCRVRVKGGEWKHTKLRAIDMFCGSPFTFYTDNDCWWEYCEICDE